MQSVSISEPVRSLSPTSVRDFDKHVLNSIKISGTTTTKTRSGFVSPEALAKRWGIGLEAAKKTVEVTTQRAVRDLESATGTRRLKPYAAQLRYKRLDTEMFSDIFYGPCRSLEGNKFAVVYATRFHWTHVYPVKSRTEAHYSLDDLFRRHGVPVTLIPDNAGELTGGEYKKKAQKAQCHLAPIEAYTPNQNFAEPSIRELRRTYRKMMEAKETLDILWDRAFTFCSLTRSHTALNIHSLHGQVPAALLTGDTPDISALCEFAWYDWVWYLDPTSNRDGSMERKYLGRYCGPSYDVGDAMCSMILKSTGTLIARSSVLPLSSEDERSDAVKAKKEEFTASLKQALGSRYRPVKKGSLDSGPVEFKRGEIADSKPIAMPSEPVQEPYVPTEPGDLEEPQIEEADSLAEEAFDKYVTARVFLPQGDQKAFGTVIKRKRGADGNLIGKTDNNPIKDTSVYQVQFDTGEVEEYTANIIAENIYSQVDDDGFTTYSVKDFTDYRSDNTAVKSGRDAYITVKGVPKPKMTTKGWDICVEWMDGSTSWVPLKDVKDAEPVRLAEFAVAMGIDKEPAFAWWVPHTLKKRDRIIKRVKKRYFRKHQKYGIEMPKTVARALEIDKETGTTYWADAIKKEMKGVWIAFEILDEKDEDPLVGFTKINCHMVFDIKPDFSRKARFVAGGHMTEPPAEITFASVVSRESVRIAFMLAALNDLDVQAADIGNAYLNAPCREKIWIRCGPEFGRQFQGRRAKVVRALYGLKSSGAAWRSHLAQVLHHELQFKACKADNDVWMRPATKPDGTKYYEYVLVYTDDILCISMKPMDVLTHLDQHFLLKPNSIGPPTQYLGASVKKWTVGEDSVECWAMGSEQYVKEAIRNVKNWLGERGKALKSKAPSVLPSNYRPELDVTPLLDDDDANYFQQQIGVLRWAVELGRIDICCEVSMLASYLAAPRQGHLEAIMHLFSYLDRHERSHLVFNPSYPPIVPAQTHDWTDFYRDVKIEKPQDMPEPRGKQVKMTTFVDSDHAGDKVTRRSRTGVLVYLNRSPIVWYSKKQGSIETSSFGSEFTAMKTAVEISEGLRYKLQMMGVDLDGPTHILADNQSVIKNSSQPESTLKKKSNSIAYHYVRERVAAGIVDVSYVNTKKNLADMLTKIQSGPERMPLVKKVLY
jgi:hypothetical protein